MALLFCDGFDSFSAATLAAKWDVVSAAYDLNTNIVMQTGRYGTGKLLYLQGNVANPTISYSAELQKYLSTNYTTLIMGCAVYNFGVGSTYIFGFMDNTTRQVDVRMNSNNQFYITRNGTVLGTTTKQYTTNMWNYIELKVTFGATGSYELRIDNASVLTGSSVNTIATANAYANRIILGFATAVNFGQTYNTKYDDLYLCDTSGSVNNDFLGDLRVIGLFPNAAGTNTGFTKTGTAATNWQAVNEIPYDGDTNYVSSNVVNTTDTYNYQDLPATAVQVKAVAAPYVMRKDDSGTRTAAPYVVSGGSSAAGPSVSPSVTYNVPGMGIMETNPTTSAAWTPTEVNNAEFGIRIAS